LKVIKHPLCNAGNFKPSSLITLNWSTYLGMSNLILIENGAILITFMHCSMFLKSNHAGFDIGAQQNAYKSDKNDVCFHR
jgi:hypothetical protein